MTHSSVLFVARANFAGSSFIAFDNHVRQLTAIGPFISDKSRSKEIKGSCKPSREPVEKRIRGNRKAVLASNYSNRIRGRHVALREYIIYI